MADVFMRHRKSKNRLPLPVSHAKAMLRNLAVSLITYGRIETTVKRAKVLRPFVEKIITRSRRCASAADYASRDHDYRMIQAELRNDRATAIATRVWGPYFLVRPGGYTRILRTGFRAGDCAELAIIEFVLDQGEAHRTTHAEVLRSLDDFVPSGIKYLVKWRALPRPSAQLQVDDSQLDKGKVSFALSMALPSGTGENSAWPRHAGRDMPMEITLSVSAPKSASILNLVADSSEGRSPRRTGRVKVYLDPSRRISLVEGVISLSEVPTKSRYCTISVDGPAGEIFHATLIDGGA